MNELRVEQTVAIEPVLDEAHRAAGEAIQSLRAALRACPSHELPDLLVHAIEVLRQLECIDEAAELARALPPGPRADEHARDAHLRALALSREVGVRYRGFRAPGRSA